MLLDFEIRLLPDGFAHVSHNAGNCSRKLGPSRRASASRNHSASPLPHRLPSLTLVQPDSAVGPASASPGPLPSTELWPRNLSAMLRLAQTHTTGHNMQRMATDRESASLTSRRYSLNAMQPPCFVFLAPLALAQNLHASAWIRHCWTTAQRVACHGSLRRRRNDWWGQRRRGVCGRSKQRHRQRERRQT